MTEIQGQMSIFDFLDRDTWSGKTLQEPLVLTREKISERSSKKPQKLQMKMPMFLDLRETSSGAKQDASWVTDGVSLGECMMHSISEFHKDEKEYVYLLTSMETQPQRYYLNCSEKPMKEVKSKLSWVLEKNPDPKYNLSEKACQGILNRASRRGKELPQMLKDALIRQATPSKLGGGVEVDSYGKRAGKGALIQTELSGTLGVSQDQTLITNCLNPWDVQSKHIQPENGIAEALYSGECRGGGGESYVMQDVYGFEPGVAQRLDPENRFVEEQTPTLRANMGDNQTAVVYGISPYDSNAMKSNNPHSGIYEADTSRTLDLNGGSPACNQGGMAVVYNGSAITSPINAANPKEGDPYHTLTDDSRNYVVCLEGNGQRESHKGDGYKESETMYTLNTVEQHGVMLFEPRSQDGIPRIYENRVCPTLNTAQGGQRQPCIVDDSISYQETVGTLSPGSHAGSYNGQDAYNDMLIVDNSQEPITMTTEMTPKIDDNGVGFSLRSRDYKDPPVVTYGLDRASFNQGKNAQFDFSIEKEKIGSQLSRGPGAVCASVVRRLTPMECERLQGFPDHWTDIGEWIDSKGKKHKDADSPRYKALGNSIALPFWGWLAERIVAQYDKKTTMASLFDGIGGFPLVFSRCGCEPIWASEIEEFPIAVTKLRFPDKEETND